MARRKREPEEGPFDNLFIGLSMMQTLGMEQEHQEVIEQLCQRIYGPPKPAPIPRAEFNPADKFRAHGLGVDLNEDSL